MRLNLDSVGTVPHWRAQARRGGSTSWREAMRVYALAYGEAMAHLADDRLRVVRRDPDKAAGVTVRTLAGIAWR